MATQAFVHNAVGITGVAEAGARLRGFVQGTTTPRTLYTNSGLSVAATFPYVADAAGHIIVYYDDALDWTFQVKTANDASTLLEVDVVSGVVSITYADLGNFNSFQNAIADFIEDLTTSGIDATWVAPLAATYITPQPVDATLSAIAALGLEDGKVIVGTGVDTAENVAVSDLEVTATGSTTERTLADRFGDTVNVADHGAVTGGAAGALLTAFQAAIDALPSNGGQIFVPEGTYTNLVPGSLDVGSKVVTWVSLGATLPDDMPGAVLSSGLFSINDWSGNTNRNGEVQNFINLGEVDPPNSRRDRAFHVSGFLNDNPAATSDRVLAAYSFNLGTDHDDLEGGDVRGLYGKVYADGGQANLRAIRVLAEGYNGHTGNLSGLLATVVYTDETVGDPGSVGNSYAVRGSVGAGTTGCFEASSFGGINRPSFGYVIADGSNALRPEVACFQGHGGGNGDIFRGVVSDSDSTEIFAVEKTGKVFGQSYRSGQANIAQDSVLSITPVNTSGIVRAFFNDVDESFVTFFYRASGTHICKSAGTNGTNTTLNAGTVPDGTTGDANKLNVFVASGQIHFENQQAATRLIKYTIDG
jgi:hypothetical protein